MMRIVSANGTTLAYAVDGTGPPLVFIHGGGEDKSMYERQVEALADRCTVVTYDRRGTGMSGHDDWPLAERGVERHAEDAAALIGALGLGRPLVWGGSSGALVALALAARHPGVVDRVIAWEPPLAMGGTSLHAVEEFLALHEEITSATRASYEEHPADDLRAHRTFYTTWFGADVFDDWDAALMHAERRNFRTFWRDDWPHLCRWLADEAELEALCARLRRSRARVHVAYGAETDPFFQQTSELLARRLGVRAETIEGAGHDPWLTDPGLVASFIREASP